MTIYERVYPKVGETALLKTQKQQMDYKFVQNSSNFNCGVRSSSH